MKKIARFCILMLLVVAASGCCSTPLIDSARRADPPPTEIHGAYQRENDIVMDYSVGKRTTRRYCIGPARYWATIKLDDIETTMGKQYTIHRSPLHPDRVANWSPVPIINLTNHIERASDGHYKFDTAHAFVRTIPEKDLPIVTVLPQCGNINNSFFSIVFIDPNTGVRRTLNEEPYAVYIPLKNYPRLIVLFPFAIVGDILTSPLLLLVPDIDG